MYELSAPNIVVAPLEPARSSFLPARVAALAGAVERLLERERAQLPLWFVVAVGAGVAGWLNLPGPIAWTGFLIAAAGIFGAGLILPEWRIGRALIGAGAALALGCGVIWLRSTIVAAPVLERPVVARFSGTIEKVETKAARGDLRLTIRPDGDDLPNRIRLSLPIEGAPDGLARGARIAARARLAPPPPMAFPGTHDHARDFWFQGVGGTGRALGPVIVTRPVSPSGMDLIRSQLDTHIRERLPGSSGTIATALATGDQHAVSEDDAEAMRRSGLTHLLSVSGLHIAAAVGAAMLLTLKLLALSERLALRINLILVAACVGALTGIGYTWLTGLQVPTVRSCIAALLVLVGIAMGREAISLRLVATGALAVMLVRPEALAGASFQMSFAAVTAIIVFHAHPWTRRWFAPREEGFAARFVRSAGALIGTGLAVESALIPIALFHFHKSGLHGVAANLIAIPWTTFVIMPLEATALALDAVGLGAPAWAMTGWAIDRLLGLAHLVGDSKGSVMMMAAMPPMAFAAMVIGGLWLCLWEGKVRRWGLLPLMTGAAWAIASDSPDLLVTADGRHVAIVRPDGPPAMLRPRTGDYMMGLLGEASGFDGDPLALDADPDARCSPDACIATIRREGRNWQVLAIRSRHFLRWSDMIHACKNADIVIADRRLPEACTPRWLKLDRPTLAASGGLSIRLGTNPRIDSVAARNGGHPWAAGVNSGGSDPPAGPGFAPGRAGNAAPRTTGSPDRGGSSALRDGTS